MTLARGCAQAPGTTARCLIVVLLASLAGCESLPSVSSWIPSIPVPSIPWFSNKRELAPLPAFKAETTPRQMMEVPVGGKTTNAFAPIVISGTLYAAGADGTIVRVDLERGEMRWQINAGKPLSAGVGANENIVVVGTNKGDVLAFDGGGKPLWQAKVSSEVAGPPRVAEGIVIVWSLDGKIFGLAAADGSRKWVYQRSTPPLTVRRFPGGVVSRGAVFTGSPGGKLAAIDILNGTLGWEGNVATPKGATELERIADVTSLPVVETAQVCAVAYQGRLACFDPVRGTLLWSRDISSLGGMTADNRYIYLTDDKGAVHGLDKSTGASIWKQDKLARRFPSGPVILGDYVGVVDAEGYMHLLDRDDGTIVGRVATDGMPPIMQPIAANDFAYWQTSGGMLVSASAR